MIVSFYINLARNRTHVLKDGNTAINDVPLVHGGRGFILFCQVPKKLRFNVDGVVC